MNANQIIKADCLEYLPTLSPDSVQLVFGSPPYEDARTYSIGFGLKGSLWVEWMADVYLEALRVCDGLVAFVMEGRTKNYAYSSTPILLMAELIRRGVTLRKPPIFHRVGIPGSGGPDWLRNDYEFIVCATNGGKLPWSDNTAMGHTPKWAPGGEMSHRLGDGRRVNQWGNSSKSGGSRKQNGERQGTERPGHKTYVNTATRGYKDGDTDQGEYTPPNKANPGNVIKCNVGGGQMGNKLAHENEAPFPESLAEFFIRSFCPPGGIVLDPFCGSGTTCAVAQKTGRRFIGLDIRKSQTELTRRRLEEDRAALQEIGEVSA